MAAIDNITFDTLDTPEHIDSAIKVVSTAYRGIDRKKRQTMVAAAYTTYAAVEAGIKQARLAEAWGTVSEEDPKKVVPMSGSYIVLLKRVGKAAKVLGIEPGTERWTRLAGKSGATMKEVGKVIDGTNVKFDETGKPTTEPLTMELLDEVLSHAFDGLSKRKSAVLARSWAIRNGEQVEDKSDEDANTDGEGQPDSVDNTRSNKVQVEAALALLAIKVPDLSPEEFTAVEAGIAKLAEVCKKAQAFRDKAVKDAEAEKKSA
jgi:hypothetical protein